MDKRARSIIIVLSQYTTQQCVSDEMQLDVYVTFKIWNITMVHIKTNAGSV